MKGTNIFVAALFAVGLASGQALAFGDDVTQKNTNTNNNSPTAVATGGAGGGGGQGGAGGAGGAGGSANSNASSDASAGAAAGAIAGSNSGGNTTTQSVGGDDHDVDVYNPGAASAAGNNVWACSKSWNVEARSIFGGLAVGIPESDEVCEAGQFLSMVIEVNQHVDQPHLIELAATNLRMLLQERVGYEATKTAIKEEGTGKTYTHAARPAHCYNADGEVVARFGMSEADKLECGVDG